MTFVDALSHPFWRAWAETLLHFLWQGAILGLIAAVLLHRRSLRTASQRYAVALATLLLMAACVPITFAIVAPAVSARNASPPLAESTISASMLPAGDELPTATRFETFLFNGVWSQPETLCRWVVVVWSMGVVALSLRIFASWIGMRLLARGRQPVPTSIENTIASLSGRMRLRRVPLVFASARVIDATVVGFLKPIVLLPAAWLVDLPPDMLEAVLAHELAHIRRHDLWINLVQRAVETVLFYHPAVWWVSRRLRAEREMCCDELAVSVTHQRLVYVTTLESVARRRAGLVKPALAVTLGDQDMALLKRIQHILGFSAAPNGGWWPAGIVALALPAALWFGWSTFVPGTKAVADETAAKKEADEAVPAKSDDRDEEERPAPAREREPDGPPGPPPGERPAAGRAAPMRGYGRAAGPGRLMMGIGKEGPSVGRPDDDRRSGEDDDHRPVYGRVGVPGAAHGAGGVRMPMGHRGPPQSRPEAGDDDDSDARPNAGRAPGFGLMPGPRGAGIGARVNPPRGRHVDEDESDSQPHQAGAQDEMVRLLRDLHREVEQLRREVRELRDDRHPAPRGARGVGRRGPPSNEGRDDELRESDGIDEEGNPHGLYKNLKIVPGQDGVDEEGNPLRFYREDRDGNLSRDGDRGTRVAPPFRKDRLSGERPRGRAPIAPGGRPPDGPARRPDDSSRGRDGEDNDGPPQPPRAGKPVPPDDGREARPADGESNS